MGVFKSIWHYLVDHFLFFTAIEVYRNSGKYRSRLLCEGEYNRTRIHFIHRYVTSNVGDKACGYYNYCLDYFSKYRCYVHDINSVDYSLIKKGDVAIVGGGGLIDALNEWNYTINKVTKYASTTIIWAAGFNTQKEKHICCNIKWDRFRLVSIRDYNHPLGMTYVPCATCLMPQLDKQYDIVRKIGVIIHECKKQIPLELMKYERIDNSIAINDFVSFIGQSEIIVSNSYHAIYWATLMHKKIVLFGATSEKFKFLRYMPTVYSGDILYDIDSAKAYDNVLKESRKMTYDYINEILKEIRIA